MKFKIINKKVYYLYLYLVGDKNTKQNKYVPNFISKTNREDQPNSTSSLPIIITDSKKKEVKNSVNMKLKDFNLQWRLVLK